MRLFISTYQVTNLMMLAAMQNYAKGLEKVFQEEGDHFEMDVLIYLSIVF